MCLVAQSCPTLSDLMDLSLPGFSIHGDSPGKNSGVGCHALLQGIFPTQGLNPGLLHCRQILYGLSHQGSPLCTGGQPVSNVMTVSGEQWRDSAKGLFCTGYILSLLSHVQVFVTPWTVAKQAPLSMGIPRQEYWNGSPFSTTGDLPDPEIKRVSCNSCISRQILCNQGNYLQRMGDS